MGTSWMQNAACIGWPTELFYPHGEDSRVPDGVKRLCASCPVRTDCLEWILEIEPPGARHGYWGGTTPKDRKAIHSKRLRTKGTNGETDQ